MEIVKKEPERKEFDDFAVGECFRDGAGEYFMKVKEVSVERMEELDLDIFESSMTNEIFHAMKRNAVNIGIGELVKFVGDELFIPLNVSLTYSE